MVLMSLRPKDGPAKPRSEGQRPLIWDNVLIPQNFVVDRAAFLTGLQRKGGPPDPEILGACLWKRRADLDPLRLMDATPNYQ